MELFAKILGWLADQPEVDFLKIFSKAFQPSEGALKFYLDIGARALVPGILFLILVILTARLFFGQHRKVVFFCTVRGDQILPFLGQERGDEVLTISAPSIEEAGEALIIISAAFLMRRRMDEFDVLYQEGVISGAPADKLYSRGR